MAISMQFLYVLRPSRIAMITEGATEREQEVVGRHFRHLQSLAAQGVVLMAGRTEDAGAEDDGCLSCSRPSRLMRHNASWPRIAPSPMV